jgi:hypothetical protein
MPTEAYALCPGRPMPSRTSYERSKGYTFLIAPQVDLCQELTIGLS